MLDAGHGSAALEPRFTHITCRVGTNQGSFCLSDRRYRRTVRQMPANDPFGKQPWQTIEAKDRRGILDLRLMLRSDDGGHCIAKTWLANRSTKPLKLGPLLIEATRPGDWHGGRVLKLWHFEQEEFMVDLKEGETFGGVYATATNRPAFSGAFLSTEHYLGMVVGYPRQRRAAHFGQQRRRRRHASGRPATRERAGVVLCRPPSLGRTGTLGRSGRPLEPRPHLAAELCHLVLLVLRPDPVAVRKRGIGKGHPGEFADHRREVPQLWLQFYSRRRRCARPHPRRLAAANLVAPQRVSGDGRGDEGQRLLARMLV